MNDKQNRIVILIVQIFILIIFVGIIVAQTIRMDKYDKQIDNYNKLIEEVADHCNFAHNCDCPWMDGDTYQNIIELNKELYYGK